jgi:hypothetical protein
MYYYIVYTVQCLRSGGSSHLGPKQNVSRRLNCPDKPDPPSLTIKEWYGILHFFPASELAAASGTICSKATKCGEGRAEAVVVVAPPIFTPHCTLRGSSMLWKEVLLAARNLAGFMVSDDSGIHSVIRCWWGSLSSIVFLFQNEFSQQIKRKLHLAIYWMNSQC